MTASIDVFALVAGLFGGLGLFLLGLQQLTESLKQLAGDQLAALLTRLTHNRLTAVGTGMAVTAVVQSSSITTVLTVGFVTAGAMTFQQSIGVVLGANVGSTFTAQAIAFDIESWAFVLVAVGALGLVFGRGGRIEVRSSAVLGLGLVFVGMQVMSTAVAPLRDSEAFLDAMARFSNPVLGVGAGAAFTALVQSSSATTAMVITLAGQGLISLEAGAAIIVGANVGSCVTAGLAAIGKPAPARQVAAFHVLVNLLGALAWVGLLDQLVELAGLITPERGTSGDARQLANAHTIFNVSVLVALFPLAGAFARLVERLVPSEPRPATTPLGSHLDRSLLSTPALALAATRLELGDLGDRVLEMVRRAPDAVLRGSRRDLAALAEADDDIDHGYRAVVTYLTELGREPLTDEQTEELVTLLTAAVALENIGDIVETNLVALGTRRLDADVRYAPERVDEIRRVHGMVLGALRTACRGIARDDEPASHEVLRLKRSINATIDGITRRSSLALDAGDRRALLAFSIEVDVLEQLRRIHYFTRRLARARLGLEEHQLDPTDEPGDLTAP